MLFDVGAVGVNACDVVVMPVGNVHAGDTTVGVRPITRVAVVDTLAYIGVAACVAVMMTSPATF